MANGDEIGAKIVLTGEDRGASSTIKATADAQKQLGAATTQAGQSAAAAARMEALLNTELKDASAAQLREVDTELRRIVSEGRAAGQQLEAVKTKIEAIGKESASRGPSAVGALGGELQSLAGQIPGIGAALGQLGGVLGAAAPEAAALALAVGTIIAALKEYAEKQSRVIGLDVALAQQGELTDTYREKLQALAAQYGKLVGGAGTWIGVLQKLTDFGADESNIEKYAVGVKNLAGAMGGDVAGASVAFTRALTGHTRELEVLGFQVDKTASKTEQLDSLMAQFAQRGGQQLEARNQSLAGTFDRLTHAGGNFLPAVGALIAKFSGLQAVFEYTIFSANFLGKALSDTIPKTEGLTNHVGTLQEKLKGLKTDTDDAADALADELPNAATTAKDSADSLVKDGLAKITAEMGKIADSTKGAIKAIDEFERRADALDDADLALEVAEIKAAPGDESSKIERERDARKRSTDRKQQRQDASDQGRIAALQSQAADERGVAAGASVPAAGSAQALKDAQARQREIETQYNAAGKELAGLDTHLAKPVGAVGGFATDAAFAEANTRRFQLDRQMKAWFQEAKTLKDTLPALQAKADADKQVYEKARETSDKVTRDNAAQVRQITVEGETRRTVQGKQRAVTEVEQAADDERRKQAEQAQGRALTRELIQRRLTGNVYKSPRDKADDVTALEKLDDADAKARPVAPSVAPLETQNRREKQSERRQKELGTAPRKGGSSTSPVTSPSIASGEVRDASQATTQAVGDVARSFDEYHQHNMAAQNATTKRLNDLATQVKKALADARQAQDWVRNGTR